MSVCRKTAKAHSNRAPRNQRQGWVGKQHPGPTGSPTRTNTTSTKPGNYTAGRKQAGKQGSPTDPRGRGNEKKWKTSLGKNGKLLKRWP